MDSVVLPQPPLAAKTVTIRPSRAAGAVLAEPVRGKQPPGHLAGPPARGRQRGAVTCEDHLPDPGLQGARQQGDVERSRGPGRLRRPAGPAAGARQTPAPRWSLSQGRSPPASRWDRYPAAWPPYPGCRAADLAADAGDQLSGANGRLTQDRHGPFTSRWFDGAAGGRLPEPGGPRLVSTLVWAEPVSRARYGSPVSVSRISRWASGLADGHRHQQAGAGGRRRRRARQRPELATSSPARWARPPRRTAPAPSADTGCASP